MRDYIKRLTLVTEFAIVIFVAFGFFIFGSLLSAIHPPPGPHHSHAGLLSLCLYEVALMAILAPFLGLRGWTLEQIGLVPGFKDAGIGVLIFVGMNFVWMFVWYFVAAVAPGTAQSAAAMSTKIIAHGVPLWIAALISIINPVFEEVFATGYVITALREKYAPLICVNVSVAIRLLYHLYQGPLGVISIIPFGLIFASWYVRTGRLWPLIVAHALQDFLTAVTV